MILYFFNWGTIFIYLEFTYKLNVVLINKDNSEAIVLQDILPTIYFFKIYFSVDIYIVTKKQRLEIKNVPKVCW